MTNYDIFSAFSIFLNFFQKTLDFFGNVCYNILAMYRYADVAELADALASGASGSNVVWVQVPSSAPVRSREDRKRLLISRCGSVW